ncbi:hypothetical protein [Micromonospora sp. NPDC004551]|uniref:hypothetical protein n=1 Tax=Micromonospora sp. NPDC004551 TaxID=3154284 RepID=UPI0033A655ED
MTDQTQPLSAADRSYVAFVWQSTAKGRLDRGTFSSTLELFDYGVTVTVKRPTDVVKVRK